MSRSRSIFEEVGEKPAPPPPAPPARPTTDRRGIAVWLAVDYRHLPVKLRFFDRDGKQMAEQVVDQIQISDE